MKKGSALRRRLAVLVIALALLGGLGWITYERIRALAPARLRAEVEGVLASETHGPVEIGALQLVWGLPLELHGAGLRLYDGALTVETARARINLLSLLRGHPHLSRLELDGAEFRFTQDKKGTWTPRLGKAGPPHPENEEVLKPLRAVGGVVRFLLDRPVIADTVVVKGGHLSAQPSGRGARSLDLVELQGELSHSRLLGTASLELQGRWVDGRTERGALTWTGSRTPNGRIALRLSAERLALSALAPWLRGGVPGLALRGRLDGVADFEGLAPGRDRLALALTARDLEARVGGAEGAEWLQAPRLVANARLALDPSRLTLSDVRVVVGEWSLALDASMARPFGPEATTRGRVAIENLALDPDVARKLVGWLPDSVREPARDLVGRVRQGRLLRGELEAQASLGQWRAAIDGRLDEMLPALSLSAEIDGVEVALNEASRLENVSGSLAWSGGLLEVKDARALLDGQPLPVLDVNFRGLARLLASDPADRVMHSTAVSLPGIAPLLEVFQSPPDRPSPPPSIALDLEHLHHRALFWPLRRMLADVVPSESELHVAIRSALWAGVPISGEVDWAYEPERRVAVRIEATEAQTTAPVSLDASMPAPMEAEPAPVAAAADDAAWAVGRIEIGPTQGSFRQRRTSAHLRAEGARVRFDGIRCELDPSGEITGALDLDLARADAVPYSLDAKLASGDLGALLAQRGMQGEPMTGTLDLGGRLAGTLVPRRALLHDADGAMTFALRDGTIPKTVPPVLALALASDSLNPFSSRARIRYSRIGADLSFASGTVSTQALEVEGPDLRLFAAGQIGLQDAPNPLRAELALFLFRQLDWALVKIPILNELLLGENKNLVAAYFKLMGTWQEPVAQPQPLLTVKDTAGGDILEGIPRVVIQGVKAIGGLFLPADPAASEAPAPSPGAPGTPAGS